MMILGFYSILSAAMFYLGSRALITRPLWSRYPSPVAHFMDCPACTGFWWGLVCALVFGYDVGPFLGDDITTPLIVALCTLWSTPITAGAMQWGLYNVGSATDLVDLDEAARVGIHEAERSADVIPLHGHRGEPDTSA